MKKEIINLELQNALAALSEQDRNSLLLAVSGGKDSMVLLEAMLQYTSRTNGKIIVAHYDHGLRPESKSDQEFVKNYCHSKGVEYFTEIAPKFDTSKNLEAWARENRYAFLEKIRKQVNASFIVTAHHRNDLAETVLMRVLSGRASISFGGILKLDYEKRLFRPLLQVTREQIDQYALENKIAFIVDSSNSNWEFTRNRLRNELIPSIEQKINPGLVDSLCVLSERINADEESINSLVNRIYVGEKNSNSWEFFLKYPKYIRWRLLKLELEKQLGRSKVGYNSLSRLADAVDTKDGFVKTIELGWGVNCVFSRKGVLEFVNSPKE